MTTISGSGNRRFFLNGREETVDSENNNLQQSDAATTATPDAAPRRTIELTGSVAAKRSALSGQSPASAASPSSAILSGVQGPHPVVPHYHQGWEPSRLLSGNAVPSGIVRAADAASASDGGSYSYSYSYSSSNDDHEADSAASRPSHLSGGHSSYDSTSSSSFQFPASSMPPQVGAVAPQVNDSHEKATIASPVRLDALLATRMPHPASMTSPSESVVIDMPDTDTDSDSETSRELHLLAERQLTTGTQDNDRMLRQLTVKSLADPCVSKRTKEDVAIKVPEAGAALTVDVISAALREYEAKRNEQLYPSLSGRLALPDVHYQRLLQQEHRASKSVMGPRNAERHRVNHGSDASSGSYSASCGCVSSCTCRHQDNCGDGVNISTSDSVCSSSPSCSCSQCENASSCCSVCRSSTGSSNRSCCGVDGDKHRNHGRHRHRCDDPFQAGNLLEAPTLLFLPPFSRLMEKHGGAADAVDADWHRRASQSRGGLPLPRNPTTDVSPVQGVTGGPVRIPISAEKEAAQLAEKEAIENENREHRQFLEDALTTMGVNLARTNAQLETLQRAHQEREHELLGRLTSVQEELGKKDEALCQLRERQEASLREAKEVWRRQARERMTERPTSPVQCFAMLAQEECARQRAAREGICSKGTMTLFDPLEGAALPNETQGEGHRDAGEDAPRETRMGANAEDLAVRTCEKCTQHETFMNGFVFSLLASLAKEEERCRVQWCEHEAHTRQLLAHCAASLPVNLVQAETTRVLQVHRAAWEMEAAAKALENCLKTDIVAGEATRRKVLEDEQALDFSQSILQASLQQRAGVSSLESERRVRCLQEQVESLSSTVEALRVAKAEAGQREASLRLQLLNALRMPTTTIVQRPSYFDVLAEATSRSRDPRPPPCGAAPGRADEDTVTRDDAAGVAVAAGASGAAGVPCATTAGQTSFADVERASRDEARQQQLLVLAQQQRLLAEAELPVHRRFARAHQEAIKAVRAQHRTV